MIKYLLMLITLLICAPTFAQYQTVVWEKEKSWFDNGQPLPAHSQWILNGEASPTTSKVTLEIFKKETVGNKALFEADWVRTDEGGTFMMPIALELNDNSRYAFRIKYYKQTANAEKQALQEEIVTHCMDYVKNSCQTGRRKIKLLPGANGTLNGMNAIVQRYLRQYSAKKVVFPRSIQDAIHILDGLKLNQVKNRQSISENESMQDLKFAFFNEKLKELEGLLRQEVRIMLPNTMNVLMSTYLVENYPTEKLAGSLAVDVGYAGIYGSGGLKNLHYSSGAFVGISLPLVSNKNHDFSISTGVFLTKPDFDDGKGPARGPLIGVPLYAGLSYKFLKVVRITGGMVALEHVAGSTAGNAIFVRPFLGAGIGLNVSAARH